MGGGKRYQNCCQQKGEEDLAWPTQRGRTQDSGAGYVGRPLCRAAANTAAAMLVEGLIGGK